MSIRAMITESFNKFRKRISGEKIITTPRIHDIAGETQEQMIHRVLLTLGFSLDHDFRFDYHCESSVADNYVKIYPDHLYVKIYAKAQAYTDSDSIQFPLASAQDLMDQVIYHTYLD